MQPLDPTFNRLVLRITDELLPRGFDVSPNAPQTYEELKQLLDSGHRLCVWNGFSGKTIYRRRFVNYAFRAWHDLCHYRGAYPFTYEGEYAVYEMQVQDIYERYAASEDTRRWTKLLHIEIVEQCLHKQRTGSFPEDQYTFAIQYFSDGNLA